LPIVLGELYAGGAIGKLYCIYDEALSWEEIMVEIGREPPDFCLTADDDSMVCRKDLKGMWFALYFYSKDNTSG
jgi:hypothetical protein